MTLYLISTIVLPMINRREFLKRGLQVSGAGLGLIAAKDILDYMDGAADRVDLRANKSKQIEQKAEIYDAILAEDQRKQTAGEVGLEELKTEEDSFRDEINQQGGMDDITYDGRLGLVEAVGAGVIFVVASKIPTEPLT